MFLPAPQLCRYACAHARQPGDAGRRPAGYGYLPCGDPAGHVHPRAAGAAADHRCPNANLYLQPHAFLLAHVDTCPHLYLYPLAIPVKHRPPGSNCYPHANPLPLAGVAGHTRHRPCR